MLKNLSLKRQQGFSFVKKEAGFTLVELLVAIAIIAILAVIGLTVFTGLQRSARDAERRADVAAIGKALEANYNSSSAQYVPLTTTMFAGGGIPNDPLRTLNNCAGVVCIYCITAVSGGGANPADPNPSGAGAACPNTGYTEPAAGGIPAAGTTGFLVCTNLEGGAGSTSPTHYCIGSQR